MPSSSWWVTLGALLLNLFSCLVFLPPMVANNQVGTDLLSLQLISRLCFGGWALRPYTLADVLPLPKPFLPSSLPQNLLAQS